MNSFKNLISQIQDLFDAHPALEWLLAAGAVLVLAVIIKTGIRLLCLSLEKFAKKTARKFDDTLVECLKQIKTWVIFFWLLHPAISAVDEGTMVSKITYAASVIASSIQVIIWGLIFIRHWKGNYLAKRVGHDTSSLAATELMGTMIKAAFIALITLLCLSNLGVNIATLIAGLGVGGIAVALAAQNILGDIFASLSIVLDKPFVLGDFITVGNDQGTVENIGIKTTRVRSLSGEQLVFSNKDLLESRIKNFKRMWKRRVVINFNIPYTTPLEKAKMIPEWVKTFIGEEPKTAFDRCHLASFGASALNYELVYWVNDADFNLHMNIQQTFFFKMLAKLEENDIQVALPTQALYISESEKNQMAPSDFSKQPVPRDH